MIENEKEMSGSVSAWQWWFGDVCLGLLCAMCLCVWRSTIFVGCTSQAVAAQRVAAFSDMAISEDGVAFESSSLCAVQNRRCLVETMSRLQSNRRIRHNCEELKFCATFYRRNFLIPRRNRLVTMALAQSAITSSQLIIEYASRWRECETKLEKSSLIFLGVFARRMKSETMFFPSFANSLYAKIKAKTTSTEISRRKKNIELASSVWCFLIKSIFSSVFETHSIESKWCRIFLRRLSAMGRPPLLMWLFWFHSFYRYSTQMRSAAENRKNTRSMELMEEKWGKQQQCAWRGKWMMGGGWL